MRLKSRGAFRFILFLLLLAAAAPLLTGCGPAEEYTGELKDGVPHGQGTWTHRSGASYTGQFKDGLWHGRGTWTDPEGMVYTGEWRYGKFHGQGTLTYPDGSGYTGEWKENLKHGFGTMTWPDGRQYAGYWEEDLMHGAGTMTCPEGTVLSGEWRYGEFHLVEVEAIELDQTALTLTAGGEPATLSVLFTPEDATNQNVNWASSNSDVAAVEQGEVTPRAPGSATITVTSEDGGFTASCSVTVRPATVAVSGVRLNHTSLTLTAGEGAFTLIATIIPANATNKVVTWASSNRNVAAVSDFGVVTPVNPGQAVITVRTVDGGYTAQCTVNVVAPQPEPEPEPEEEEETEENGDPEDPGDPDEEPEE